MKQNNLNFSPEDVSKLGKLSQLYLSLEEIKKYFSQLKETLNYIRNLHQLNLEKKTKRDNPLALSNVFFKDGVKKERQLSQEEALKNARKKKNGYFVVEKIL